MQVSITLPGESFVGPDETAGPEAVTEIAKLIEGWGFDGVSVTDHPAPTARWLDGGGHHALDPFVLLSFIAAATSRIRLQTGVLVLPYRNPFLTARAVASLDLLSRGRVVLGVGAGYLRGEFRALGVDFDRRNELTDEYVLALKAALGSDEFTFQGESFTAGGNRILPASVQRPHPPLLLGGNSPRAIRRAAEMGDAWYPFFASDELASVSRTASIQNDADLASGIAYLRRHCEVIGRASAPLIIVGSIGAPAKRFTSSEMTDTLGRLADLGVAGAVVTANGATIAEWRDDAARIAEEVLPHIERVVPDIFAVRG